MKYVLSLVKTFFSRQNMGFLLYMSVNTLPICWPAVRYCALTRQMAFLPLLLPLLLVAYGWLVIIAGPLWARTLLRARNRVVLDGSNILGIAFSRAYVAAKEADPLLSDNIRLYMYDGAELDAYAFGRNTICLSSAATEIPERELTALLLLKFAQFSHHDAEMLTFMTVGNLGYVFLSVLLKGYIYAIGLAVWLLLGILGHRFVGSAVFRLLKTWADAMEQVVLLVMRGYLILGLDSYRNNVFINDRFVCICGYKSDLIRFLHNYEPEVPFQGTLLGVLDGMKPNRQLRLERLEREDNAPGAFRIIRR